MNIPLRHVTKVGDDFFTIWRMPDNSLIETPLSRATYLAVKLSETLTENKPDPDAVFVLASSRVRYDTPSGKQQVGDVVVGDAQIAVRVKNGDARGSVMKLLDSKFTISGEINKLDVSPDPEGYSIKGGILEIK